MNKSLIRDLKRDLANGKYEFSDRGVLISKIDFGGAMHTRLLFGKSFEERGPDPMTGENLVVDQGLILALIDVLANGAKVTSWFLVPFKNNATPQANWTGANIAANAGEFTNYTEATRPAFVFPDPTTIVSPSLSNPTMAVTTIGGGADFTLWGGALASNATKSDASAGTKLFAAVKFPAARTGLQTGDGIGWQYQLTGASS